MYNYHSTAKAVAPPKKAAPAPKKAAPKKPVVAGKKIITLANQLFFVLIILILTRQFSF